MVIAMGIAAQGRRTPLSLIHIHNIVSFRLFASNLVSTTRTQTKKGLPPRPATDRVAAVTETLQKGSHWLAGRTQKLYRARGFGFSGVISLMKSQSCSIFEGKRLRVPPKCSSFLVIPWQELYYVSVWLLIQLLPAVGPQIRPHPLPIRFALDGISIEFRHFPHLRHGIAFTNMAFLARQIEMNNFMTNLLKNDWTMSTTTICIHLLCVVCRGCVFLSLRKLAALWAKLEFGEQSSSHYSASAILTKRMPGKLNIMGIYPLLSIPIYLSPASENCECLCEFRAQWGELLIDFGPHWVVFMSTYDERQNVAKMGQANNLEEDFGGERFASREPRWSGVVIVLRICFQFE